MDLSLRISEPLELPASGAFLWAGAQAHWLGYDPAMVTLLKSTAPARGFVLLSRESGGWYGRRTEDTDLREARATAISAARSSMVPVILGQVVALAAGGMGAVVEAVASYEPVTGGGLVHKALDAADEALTWVQKAPPGDPFNPKVFGRMNASLGRDLAGRSDAVFKKAVQGATEKSGIDWAKATEADVRRFSVALSAALGVAAAKVWRAVHAPLLRAVNEMAIQSAVAMVKRGNLGVRPHLAAVDRVAVARVASANQFYLRDFAAGRANDMLSAKARGIVSAGVKLGHGSETIGKELYSVLGDSAAGLNRHYMQIVASAANARARVYSGLTTMDQAGIMRYRINAVIDSQTTDTCSWLDGKEFSVGAALDRHRSLENMADPLNVRHLVPWTRERTIKSGPNAGKRGIYIPTAQEEYELLAVVERSQREADGGGEYRSAHNDRELEEMGMGFPPYHPLCRTSVSAL